MRTYFAVLKDETILNKEVLNYFVEKEFTILNYHSRFKILKLGSESKLNINDLKYIESIEEEKSFGV